MLRSDYLLGIFIFATGLVVKEVNCYGFNFGYGGGGDSGSGQSQSPAASGFFWNGFKAYPQNQAQSIPVQIKFDDENETVEDPEYMYELLFGHQIKDIEKFRRQKGCLCNNRFKDPHCGSDNKNYDNGCYFECAQKRNPGLKLVNWGKC